MLKPKDAHYQVISIEAALINTTNRDEQFAHYTNVSLTYYHVPANADILEITVEFIDEHDAYVNAMDVKGTYKIFIVSTMAVVANVVYHVTGKELHSLPMTPFKVREAMSQPG
ncbi:hypothetical protein [Hymenobacter sp. BRD67]|uniref:hypothetical protein n=1 Tax=Hymenobacter sp. BRD67 TaxID=2675877 RepID=UPI0015649453|nr:hypothetical protein [Hymenobacter sp. BRD67]QKG51949.1 hypothetical protein GKZ67_04160 [Hymenobacter sp. BRD67]